MENETSLLLKWLCHDYESAEFWKSQAKRFFFYTVSNPFGDSSSDLALDQFSGFLKTVFTYMSPKSTESRQWSHDFSTQNTERIEPPFIEFENVNWEMIADYFLLCVHGSCEEIIAVNTGRTEANNKMKKRTESNIERMEVYFNALQKHRPEPLGLMEKSESKPEDKRDKDTEKELKLLKHRPKIIEEEKRKDGDYFPLDQVSSYKSKYFTAEQTATEGENDVNKLCGD